MYIYIVYTISAVDFIVGLLYIYRECYVESTHPHKHKLTLFIEIVIKRKSSFDVIPTNFDGHKQISMSQCNSQKNHSLLMKIVIFWKNEANDFIQMLDRCANKHLKYKCYTQMGSFSFSRKRKKQEKKITTAQKMRNNGKQSVVFGFLRRLW